MVAALAIGSRKFSDPDCGAESHRNHRGFPSRYVSRDKHITSLDLLEYGDDEIILRMLGDSAGLAVALY